MNRYGKGICESCHFAKNCVLHSPDEITWECSEYEPLTVFSEIRSMFVSSSNNEDVSGKNTSLCGHCSYKSNCCYYSPEIFIFNCENVQ
ncbi:MAG: hypothetical protein ACO1N0_06670 [Fluviicola sp.]